LASSSDDAELQRAFKASLIIHVAFLIAPVFYAIAMVVLDDMRMKPRLDEGLHLFVLGAFALVAVVLLLLRERLAVQGARTALNQGQGIPESLAAAHVMRSSMNETVAVLGLVGFLLTANLGVSLAFVGVGLFALLRGRPIKNEWRRAVTKGRR
jgi:hypothetical protein